MTANPLPPLVRKIGSVGIPTGIDLQLFNIETGERMKNVNEMGEICIKGASVMEGYRKNEEANRHSFWPSQWFRSGDLGYFDKDGYLFLNGRIKELINRAGEKISPQEIDQVLLSHPSVQEAVTFGVIDDLYGERIHAGRII